MPEGMDDFLSRRRIGDRDPHACDELVIEAVSEKRVGVRGFQIGEYEPVAELLDGADIVQKPEAQDLGMEREVTDGLIVLHAPRHVASDVDIRDAVELADVLDLQAADLFPPRSCVV